MRRELVETIPNVMDAKQLAMALRISKSGAYDLLNCPGVPTLKIGERYLVMKNNLPEWLKGRTISKSRNSG